MGCNNSKSTTNQTKPRTSLWGQYNAYEAENRFKPGYYYDNTYEDFKQKFTTLYPDHIEIGMSVYGDELADLAKMDLPYIFPPLWVIETYPGSCSVLVNKANVAEVSKIIDELNNKAKKNKEYKDFLKRTTKLMKHLSH